MSNKTFEELKSMLEGIRTDQTAIRSALLSHNSQLTSISTTQTNQNMHMENIDQKIERTTGVIQTLKQQLGDLESKFEQPKENSSKSSNLTLTLRETFSDIKYIRDIENETYLIQIGKIWEDAFADSPNHKMVIYLSSQTEEQALKHKERHV